MQFPAVNWHEGLFLQPQHFQAWDRHWSERVAETSRWVLPHAYGLREIAINSAALQAGFFQLDSLQAITPTGSLLNIAGGQIERVDLRQFDQTANGSRAHTLDIFAGVPRLRLGASNVHRDSAAPANGSRYTTELCEVPDEVDASSIQSVELRRPNIQILLGEQNRAGYDSLAIARLRRSQDGNSLELDPNFIPPLLDCGAWSGMRTQILSPLSDLLLRASEQAAELLADGSSTLQVNSPLKLTQMVALQSVNPAAAVLRQIAVSNGVHPQTAYHELIRTAASLDILQPARSCQLLPKYDHEDLGPIFKQLKETIIQSLTLLERKPYSQRFLVGTDSGMQTPIELPKNAEKAQWFIGVYKGNVPSELLSHLLDNLDWKFGSVRQVDELYTSRSPGIDLEPSTELPPVLPSGKEWAFFRISQTSPAWQDALETQSIALKINDTMIANRDSLQGNPHLVVQYGQHKIPLKFAIFSIG